MRLEVKAVVVPGDDVDTDVLYPGAYLNITDVETMKRYLFEGIDPSLRDQLGGDTALVVGANFGAGSSREHVPQAMHAWGIRFLVGASFARIFDTGCFPCGATLSYRCYANLVVEGELAVRLGQAVSAPSGGVDKCRAAITSVFPVIELHHYMLRSPQPSLAELIASGGIHAGFVLAE